MPLIPSLTIRSRIQNQIWAVALTNEEIESGIGFNSMWTVWKKMFVLDRSTVLYCRLFGWLVVATSEWLAEDFILRAAAPPLRRLRRLHVLWLAAFCFFLFTFIFYPMPLYCIDWYDTAWCWFCMCVAWQADFCNILADCYCLMLIFYKQSSAFFLCLLFYYILLPDAAWHWLTLPDFNNIGHSALRTMWLSAPVLA